MFRQPDGIPEKPTTFRTVAQCLTNCSAFTLDKGQIYTLKVHFSTSRRLMFYISFPAVCLTDSVLKLMLGCLVCNVLVPLITNKDRYQGG